MKTKALLILLLPCLFFMSCSSALKNDITVTNAAAATVTINVLGKVLIVPPGTSQIIKDISKGSYSYSTSYALPSGVQTSSIEGNATGQLALSAGTHIYVFYSSRIQIATGSGGTGQQTYILVVTVSSSDAVSTTTTGS
jgi:hypothetical protein